MAKVFLVMSTIRLDLLDAQFGFRAGRSTIDLLTVPESRGPRGGRPRRFVVGPGPSTTLITELIVRIYMHSSLFFIGSTYLKPKSQLHSWRRAWYFCSYMITYPTETATSCLFYQRGECQPRAWLTGSFTVAIV